MTQALDWPGLMRVGIAHLRLRPKDFWALTPAELHLMFGKSTLHLPLGRAELDRLQAAFPDHREGETE